MRYLFTLLISFPLAFQAVTAQTRIQDSTALVSLFDNTSGTQWVNKSGWKIGSINTWFGIKISSDLVTRIILPSNGLKGNLGVSTLPDHPLEKIDFSNNKLTSFPLGWAIDTLMLSGNSLTFKHLLPYSFMGGRLKYSGQDSVEQNLTIFGQQRGQTNLSVITDISEPGIKFQWYKNGVEVAGADSSTLLLSCLTLNNTGTYTCKLTHNNLPNLSIFRKSVFLIINADQVNAGPDDNVCQASYVLRGVAPITGTGMWSITKSNGSIDNLADPNSDVSKLTAGANIFKWTVSYPGCPDDYDEVTVTKDTVGELPFAGTDAVFCDSVFKLNATPLNYGKGSWQLVSGNLVFGQVTNPQSTLVSIKPGDHILRWNANNGACASFFDEVKLTRVMPLDKVFAGKDTALCGTALHLNAQNQLNVKGRWKLISGKGKIMDTTVEYSYIYDLDQGINKFEWTGRNACANKVKDTVIVKVHNFMNVFAGHDTTMYYTPTAPLAISRKMPASGGTGEYHYDWSPKNYLGSHNSATGDFRPPGLGTYTFKLVVTDDMGCKDSTVRTIEVIKVQKIDAPTLFSPNGDGENDLFILPGIESFHTNELVVMDKLGQPVYKKRIYDNEWDGTANTGSYSGDVLPDDTYFYVLDLGEGKDKVQTGFIVIKK
ncbi:MAG: gliding motility-associated C-terminal domain-containing protein [Bacteroidia bacterium]